MPVCVNNLQEKLKTDSRLLEILNNVAETALKTEGRDDDPEVSVALVDDEYIKELNLKYRHKDQSTDVLSFPMDDSGDEPFADEEGIILGDIIISVETAQRQAEEYGHSFIREMAYLAAHGMFHLLGYDHETEESRKIMREREEKVLSILNISR